MNAEFLLDDQNVHLKKVWETQSNYKIEDIKWGGGICYIFFSSNGLYYPDCMKTFHEVIEEQDKYEWKNLVRNQDELKNAGRVIFVRDIYKQYYVMGINQKINSIDKLLVSLKDITEGMEVVTCGISSGGYMAIIAGTYLNARAVFSFSGWLRLFKDEDSKELIDSGFWLDTYKESEEHKKWYDITGILQNNKVPIMYFFAGLNHDDQEQAKLALNIKNSGMILFPMKSKVHGDCCLKECYLKLLKSDISNLVALRGKRMLSKYSLCFKLMDKKEAVLVIFADIKKKHKVLQRIFDKK